jgi:hypothetical protein
MRMPGRPGQHRTGDAEIIVLSRRASIHNSAVTHLGLEAHELFIGAPARRAIHEADLIGLRFAVQQHSSRPLSRAGGPDKHLDQGFGEPSGLLAVESGLETLNATNIKPRSTERGFFCDVPEQVAATGYRIEDGPRLPSALSFVSSLMNFINSYRISQPHRATFDVIRRRPFGKLLKRSPRRPSLTSAGIIG